MKVVIAGSRTIRKYETVEKAVKWALGEDAHKKVSMVISGGQRSKDDETGEFYGADYFGEEWADRHRVPKRRMEADWDHHGRAAGPNRNTTMATVTDIGIVVWDGKSSGSMDMIRKLRRTHKTCYVYRADDPKASVVQAFDPSKNAITVKAKAAVG